MNKGHLRCFFNRTNFESMKVTGARIVPAIPTQKVIDANCHSQKSGGGNSVTRSSHGRFRTFCSCNSTSYPAKRRRKDIVKAKPKGCASRKSNVDFAASMNAFHVERPSLTALALPTKESRHIKIPRFYLNPSELTGKRGRTGESRRFLASLPRKLSIILNDEVARLPTGSACEGGANDLTSPPASSSGPFTDQLVGDEEDNHVPRKVILEDVDILLNGGFVE